MVFAHEEEIDLRVRVRVRMRVRARVRVRVRATPCLAAARVCKRASSCAVLRFVADLAFVNARTSKVALGHRVSSRVTRRVRA